MNQQLARTDRDRVRRQPIVQLAFTGTVAVGFGLLVASAPERVTVPYTVATVAVVVLGVAMLLLHRGALPSLPTHVIAWVPLADLAAWIFIRDAMLGTIVGVGLAVVFPVIWLAFAFPRRYVAVGVVLIVAVSVYPLRLTTVAAKEIVSSATFAAVLILLAVVLAYEARRVWRARRALGTTSARLRTAVRERSQAAATAEAIVSSASDAIALFDLSGGVQLSNAEFHRQMALARSGLYVRLATGEEFTSWEDLAARRRSTDFLLPARARLGGGTIVTFVVRPVVDASGESMGDLLVAHDITSLVEAIDARDRFLQTVGHELRTPLTVMLGRAELLQDVPEARAAADAIVRAGERQLAVIAQLFAAAREHVPVRPVRVAPSGVVAGVVATLRESPQFAAREVIVDAAPDVPDTWMDAADLAKIVTSLVRNALIFSPASTHVDVRLRREGGRAVVTVLDRGPGLSAQERAEAFTSFWRSDHARRQAIAGVGLGLTVARTVAEANGATIVLAEGADGIGTAAILTLPLPPAGDSGSA